MSGKLRDQLIGAWELVSYFEKPLNGSPLNHPMGKKPMGIIMYTPDGYMSAQLTRPNPDHFASDDWFKATPEEYGTAASTYFAYTGPFEVDEERRSSRISCLCRFSPTGSGKSNNELRGLKAIFCTSAPHRQSSPEDRS